MKLFRSIEEKRFHYQPIDERDVIIRLQLSLFVSCAMRIQPSINNSDCGGTPSHHLDMSMSVVDYIINTQTYRYK